jgi:hypothetical protein
MSVTRGRPSAQPGAVKVVVDEVSYTYRGRGPHGVEALAGESFLREALWELR